MIEPTTTRDHEDSRTTEDARRNRLSRSPSVIGYADVRSVRAGHTINFFVSSERSAEIEARIVRLKSPDVGPIGPPFKELVIDSPLNGHHPGTEQPIRMGSFAHVPGPLPLDTPLVFDILVFPTLVDAEARTIAELRSTSGGTLTLRHGASDGLEVVLASSDGLIASVSAPCLTERAWTDIEISIDLSTGHLGLRTHALPAIGAIAQRDLERSVEFTPCPGLLDTASLTFAASMTPDRTHHEPGSCFTGRLERPRLFRTGEVTPLAAWDFSRGIPTASIEDTGPLGLHGTITNMPTRGVRGAQWTGDHLTWTADPAGYAAIHFHDDDIADAGWSPSLSYQVPHSLPSGCYALRVNPADDSTPEFYVPFFVRPARGAPHADIAFIAPTTTYGAYANMHLRVTAQFNELAHGRLTVLDSTDFLLLRRPELGKSTYDVHRDGSPVVYSSMNRPVTNFRPTGRMYKLCLDLMIIDWLDAMGYEVDIVSEDDIDLEGAAALSPYRVLITASHPEYTTRKQLDAFEEHLRGGGRLMYLGGNGFYSAAEIPPERRDIVEVRRPGQDNLWRVNHAEAASSTSGLPTGLWRNIGRPENSLTGVGFITQGFDACTYYTRSPESHDPRVSWIFDGLDPDEVIGDFGILQGGAAGYELDRHDLTKGSPRHSVVVASSGGHSNLYELMVSSILDTLPDPTRKQDPIRADMVFFESGHGGAVFSVGSIAWAGSLSHAGYRNSVSTVTKNVLDRFVDPSEFANPPDRGTA
jgi:N,N-dimethylformamidase